MARPRKNPATPHADETPVETTANESAKSPFVSEKDRTAWIDREAKFVSRFIHDPMEARRIAETHSLTPAQYNVLRGW